MLSKKRAVLLFGLSVIFLFCVLFCFKIFDTKAEINTDYDIFDAQYTKGQTIDLPNNIIVGQQEIALDSICVKAPNGKLFNENKITFSDMGIYTAKYEFTIGGQQYTNSESITVISDLFSVLGRGDVSFKANDKTPDTEGVNAYLGQGATLKYNKVIDLNKIDASDDLIRLFVVPETIGVCDFQWLYLVLTDIYDASNKITISFNNVKDGYHNGEWTYEYSKYTVYIKAGATNQTISGYDWAKNQLHIGDTYGYSALCSFCGLPNQGKRIDQDILKISFDYAERQVVYDGRMVIDLDDSRYFSELWNGFTTGEVYLSLTTDNAGTVVITDIANEHLTENLQFFDNEEPELVVDTLSYDINDLPDAMVGTKYRLFDAVSTDTYSGALPIFRKVYYDYNGIKKRMAIQNGYFMPNKTGVYTLEYTATDYCGNSKVVLMDVNCSSIIYPITAEYDSTTKITNYKAGETVNIAKININGGYGELNVSTSVYFNQKPFSSESSFIPLNAGVYTVETVITDYIDQKKVITYDINVGNNESPVIVDEATIPNYFINNRKYQLPSLFGYNISTGVPAQVQTEIYVRDSQAESKISDGIYIPNINSDGTEITIKYVCRIGSKSTEKVYKSIGVICADNDGIRFDKYFYTDGDVQVFANTKSIDCSVSSDNSSVEFVNKLLAEDFSLRFSMLGLENFNKISFVLTDYVDKDVKVVFSIIKETIDETTSYFVEVNGNLYETNKVSFGADSSIYLVFDNVLGRIGLKEEEGNASYYSVSQSNTNYFVSGYLNLKIIFDSLDQPATMSLLKLNGQNLKYLTVDILSPSIGLMGETVGTTYKLNDKVKTVIAYGADVLDTFAQTTISVFDPNNKAVLDVNRSEIKDKDASVSYSFVLSKFGNYKIVYTVKDSTGRSSTMQYMVYAVDTEKPTISTEYEIVSSAKVNDYIYIPKAVVSDNFSTKFTINYYVITPDGVVHFFNRDVNDGFKATDAGKYTIIYVVADEAGNSTLRNVDIIVE